MCWFLQSGIFGQTKNKSTAVVKDFIFSLRYLKSYSAILSKTYWIDYDCSLDWLFVIKLNDDFITVTGC